MASITLPIGGQAVDIPIPDFAMEDTQRQVLAAVQSMAGSRNQGGDALQQAAQQQKQAADKIDDAADELEKASDSLGKSMRKTATDVGKSLLQQEQNFGARVSNLFSSMRLTALGGVFGSAFAVLEEFAGNAALLRRAGMGLGQDFTQLRDQAANVGISLGELAQISVLNNKAMTTLGDTTQQGQQGFVGLLGAFQSAIGPLGNFGMSAAETAEFLAEELEIRRQQGAVDFTERATQQQLIEGMKENLRQQEAMAAITGTDVRERIKAQRAIQGDAVMQSFLSEQTQETQKAFRDLTGTLSTVPGGEELMNALMTSIATGLPPATFAPKLIGMLQGAGLGDMQSMLAEIMSGGGDSNVLSEELVQMVREASGSLDQSTLRRAAVLPNELSETARTLLTFKNQIVSIEDVQDLYNERLEQLTGTTGEANTQMGGLILETDKATQSLQALAQRAILSAAGMGGTDSATFQRLLQDVTGFATSDITRDFVGAMGTIYGTTTGAPQLTTIMDTLQNGGGFGDLPAGEAYTALLAMANSVSPAFAQQFLSMEGVARGLNLDENQARLFGPETILAMKGASEGIAGGQFDSTLRAMGIDQATIDQMKQTAQAIEEYTIRDLGNTMQSLFGGLPAMITRLEAWLRNQTS